MTKLLSAIPLFLMVLVVYHLVIFWGSVAILTTSLLSFNMISGATWEVTGSDLLLGLGLAILYVEILRSTWTGVTSVINHTLSTLLFVCFAIEFVTVSIAANSTFFLLGLMSLIDAIAGFTITIVASRKDISL
ncbi:MAG: hypothetical protein QNJ54_03580 [Prochloraceae cyanobacterium]|nr:hypothetical protein [Prochloraceae cyanobacterium]